MGVKTRTNRIYSGVFESIEVVLGSSVLAETNCQYWSTAYNCQSMGYKPMDLGTNALKLWLVLSCPKNIDVNHFI